MRVFGIISLNIFVGIFISYLGYIIGNDFLINFLNNQILTISATIIGFNFAVVVFLIGFLLKIDGDFSKTKKEIKDNIRFMMLMFGMILFFLIIRPKINNDICNVLYDSLILALFSSQMFSVYEVIDSIFNISKKP